MVDYDIYEEFYNPDIYDLECDDFDADFPVIGQWAASCDDPLLDLACGTGRMAIHLALQGHQTTGIDVVPAMVEKARQKADAHSVSIDRVIADMRAFHLNKQFPFIFMLMNAFQFLQTRTDYEKMLARVREHLTPDGYFLFETRNPTDRNLKGLRHPEGQRYTLPDGGQLVTTEQQHYDPLTQIQHYVRELHFSYADGRQETRRLRTALRYIFPQEMEALLHYNGFKIHTCYGNWQQDPLTATSPAMIYVCQKQDGA